MIFLIVIVMGISRRSRCPLFFVSLIRVESWIIDSEEFKVEEASVVYQWLCCKFKLAYSLLFNFILRDTFFVMLNIST
jgi:hypothetical protein